MIIIKAAFALKELRVFDAAASPQIFMRLMVFEKLDPHPEKNPGSAPEQASKHFDKASKRLSELGKLLSGYGFVQNIAPCACRHRFPDDIRWNKRRCEAVQCRLK